MKERIRWSVVALVSAAGLVTGLWYDAAAFPATVAVAAAVWAGLPPDRRWLGYAAGVAGAICLAVTAARVVTGAPGREGDLFGPAESVALTVLAAMASRWAPARQAVPGVAVAAPAAATWLLRYLTPASPLEAVGACAFWGAGVLAAVGAGAYLRSLDGRRARAVADARAAQRLRLARDLHDYVAHDVSEMLAQAQAGQVAGDPVAALRRVEEAGMRAMATLDRTVLQLHDTGSDPGLGDLAELAARFSAAPVRLVMPERLRVPGHVGAAAYRIVSEALTNVRRHAPHATGVDVTVTARGGTLVITVTNDGEDGGDGGDGGAGRGEAGRGGFGLPALAGHAGSLGGELRAGAVPGGWSVTARLPLGG